LTSSVIGALSVAAAILALGLLPTARRWRLPAVAHPDRAALRDSGLTIPLRRWEALRATAALIGVILGSAAGAPLAGAVSLALVPSVVARAKAGAARERARGALAPLLVATHAGMRSGLALPEALRRAVAGCGDAIARRPFDEALARFDLGDPLHEALEFGASHTGDARVADAMRTLALGVSERIPIDRAALLLNAVAELVRHDEDVEQEVRARTAGIRLQLYLLAAVVPILSAYLLATMPGLAATLGGTLGRTVLVPGAAFLEITGIVVSRRIVRTVMS
jgi:Flp pilus assembly protein TadB